MPISFSHYDVKIKNAKGRWHTTFDKHHVDPKWNTPVPICSLEKATDLYGQPSGCLKFSPRYTRTSRR